jgi:Tol biopolymer transport system component
MRSSTFSRTSVRWFWDMPALKCGTAFVLAMLLVAGARSATGGPPNQAHTTSEATADAVGRAMQPGIGSVATQLKGDYFGEALPGTTPVPFAPSVLSSVSAWVEATAFSPDGTEFFLSVGTADYSGAKLYYSKRVNDIWTPFAEVPFVSGFTYSNEPVFSADGATLTFTGKKATGSIDLWTVHRMDNEWGTPSALPAPINSDGKDHRGSTIADGTLFFCSNRSGMMQVYKAYEDASRTLVAELLGAPINTRSYEGDPCVAPDGRFLVFYSARDGRSADLYVSFRDRQGGWEAPVNLGAAFNSPNDEYGAHLSSDGKLLFFTRHTPQGNAIYWVATSAIDKLKP